MKDLTPSDHPEFLCMNRQSARHSSFETRRDEMMARCAFSDSSKRFHRVLSPQSRLETYYWVDAFIMYAEGARCRRVCLRVGGCSPDEYCARCLMHSPGILVRTSALRHECRTTVSCSCIRQEMQAQVTPRVSRVVSEGEVENGRALLLNFCLQDGALLIVPGSGLGQHWGQRH